MAVTDGVSKVELRGVKKRFGSKIVLDGLDLAIPRGESIVVIGGSGTGKSVMIKCVLGILRPEGGEIFVDGNEVTHLSGRRRDAVLRQFGMLFQGSALFDSLPVWENVAFGLIQGRGTEWPKLASVLKSQSCGLPNFPVACRNASGWRAPLRQSRTSFSSTSRPPGSIPSWPM